MNGFCHLLTAACYLSACFALLSHCMYVCKGVGGGTKMWFLHSSKGHVLFGCSSGWIQSGLFPFLCLLAVNSHDWRHHVCWLNVCTPSSDEHGISVTPWGNCYTFGTSVSLVQGWTGYTLVVKGQAHWDLSKPCGCHASVRPMGMSWDFRSNINLESRMNWGQRSCWRSQWSHIFVNSTVYIYQGCPQGILAHLAQTITETQGQSHHSLTKHTFG